MCRVLTSVSILSPLLAANEEATVCPVTELHRKRKSSKVAVCDFVCGMLRLPVSSSLLMRLKTYDFCENDANLSHHQ